MSQEFDEVFDFLLYGDYSPKKKWIDKNTYGELDNEKETIKINVSLLIAEVFVHEWLHVKYSEYTEAQIELETNKVMSAMSDEEIKSLAKKIIKIIGK